MFAHYIFFVKLSQRKCYFSDWNVHKSFDGCNWPGFCKVTKKYKRWRHWFSYKTISIWKRFKFQTWYWTWNWCIFEGTKHFLNILKISLGKILMWIFSVKLNLCDFTEKFIKCSVTVIDILREIKVGGSRDSILLRI